MHTWDNTLLWLTWLTMVGWEDERGNWWHNGEGHERDTALSFLQKGTKSMVQYFATYFWIPLPLQPETTFTFIRVRGSIAVLVT